MIKHIFVNLPVKDLDKTKEFWTGLGFTFNATFTDEKAASLILGENIYAMLITKDFFKTFTKKEIVDSTKLVEVINALSVNSKNEVSELTKKAVDLGGKINREPDDYGWMYSQSITDLDGHIWEFLYIDETKAPK